mgnify:CR=1 FL=1
MCTFKRPSFLERLLDKLQDHTSGGPFTCSIVVVDNDFKRSAEKSVQAFALKSGVPLDYYIEPVRNISLARNKSVQHAAGDLIAFIDDDEFPEDSWLLNLFITLNTYNADGVLGPVKPHFENEPPPWLLNSGILERQSFSTGTVIPSVKYTRTGNVLLSKSLFEKPEDYFDPAYGRLGGGDAIFFKRMMQKQKRFVWCNEAIVYETVPLERQKRLYYIKRAITRGAGEAKHQPLISIPTLKSCAAAGLYALLAPCVFFSQPLFLRYSVKACDHWGKLLAYLGIHIVKERPYED